MFHTKSRKEQLQDQQASLADTAALVAEQLRERVVPAVGHAAVNAKEWARPRVEHGIEVAAPRLESAVSGLAPKVDTARDKLVEDLIPRIAEAIGAWAAASAAAKEEVVARGAGAAAVISGDAVASPKHKKRGRVLMTLGLFGAAAAGAAAFMKKSAPKDDPWATPLADPYVAPSTGRHSSVDPLASADRAAPPKAAPEGDAEPDIIESLDEPAAPDPLDATATGDTDPDDGADKG